MLKGIGKVSVCIAAVFCIFTFSSAKMQVLIIKANLFIAFVISDLFFYKILVFSSFCLSFILVNRNRYVIIYS
jgi:hypothetical protein